MPCRSCGARDFRLGDWLVEPSLNRLSRGDTSVQLRPRLVDVLSFLAQNAGTVVAKDDIIASVWERQFLAESVLTRCIAELRAALGDAAARPSFIETIHKRGYRVIAEVVWLGGEPCATADAQSRLAAPRIAAIEDIGGAQPFPIPTPAQAGVVSCCRLCWGDREIPMVEGENLIGRGDGAPVRISSTRVSRRHARIVVCGGRAVIEDLGSRNGTYAGGRRLAAPMQLWDGAEVCVGSEVFIFRFIYPGGTTEVAPT